MTLTPTARNEGLTWVFTCGAEGNRTPDLLLAKDTYQAFRRNRHVVIVAFSQLTAVTTLRWDTGLHSCSGLKADSREG